MRHNHPAEVPVVRGELPREAAVPGDDRAALGQQLVALLVRGLAVAGILEANGLGVRQRAELQQLSCRCRRPSVRMHAPLETARCARLY